VWGRKQTWYCPACADRIEADSNADLIGKQRKHILEHERKGGLRAVERAVNDCGAMYCGIKKFSTPMSYTSFDRNWLREMGIDPEDE
jgi:hypothetical protein